jgi:ribosomal protein L35
LTANQIPPKHFKLLSNGKLITRKQKKSFRVKKKNERVEKHLCKSNGVRWMNSDRLNALIAAYAYKHFITWFPVCPFFFTATKKKLQIVSTIIHSIAFNISKGWNRIEQKFIAFSHSHAVFMILSMLPFFPFSDSPSTQKYFTIDFLWHMQQKKSAPMKSLDPQVHIAIKSSDFRGDFTFFCECDLQSTTS